LIATAKLMLRVLLFDQETGRRAELLRILQAIPDVRIIGEAASVTAAIPLLERGSYDLVFLATTFLDGCGFQLTKAVRAGARTVFVASDGLDALRGYEVNALDYLITPLQPERVAATITRLRGTTISLNGSTSSHVGLQMGDRLQVEWGGGRIAGVGELSVIIAQENYSIVHLADGTRAMVRRSLKAWLDLLPAAQFVRVHRSSIVNLSRVRSVRRDGPKTFKLRVEGLDECVPVGRVMWRELKPRLPARTADF
jgi:two-component system LytT family response regulator